MTSVVAITGGARGIGLAVARRYADRGARVAIGDVDGDGAQEAARRLEGARGYTLDVGDPVQFERFVADVEADMGPIDVLVNNAGIMPIGPLLDQSPELARRVMDINVLGPLNGMRAILPRMQARGGGRIVNVASTAGRVSGPGAALYAASKHAVVGLSDGVRQEFGRDGIVITTVLPSFTDTELISGTSGLRGIRTLTPDRVAVALVRGVERGRPFVVLPMSARVSLWLTALLPTRVTDAVLRLTGGDRVFLDVDRAGREAYDRRIRARDGD
ncbi:MAG: SDR family oxidoreductase [Solirubrobacteraceae bacterium]